MSSVLRKLSNRLNPRVIRERATGQQPTEVRGDTVQGQPASVTEEVPVVVPTVFSETPAATAETTEPSKS